MKMRIWGTREQCSKLLDEIITILKIDGYEIRSCSGFYENNRGSVYPKNDPRNEGRIYLEFE